jgi:hypothetical protein
MGELLNAQNYRYLIIIDDLMKAPSLRRDKKAAGTCHETRAIR